MNVLSIDFDYFQNTNVNCLKQCYPNGIDRINEQSTEAWLSYYTRTKTARELLKVNIYKPEYEKALKLIKSQDSKCTAMIANSHISIYKLICTEMEYRNEKKLWISNIDMHHDMFNDNPELDCGNWIEHIKNKYINTRMEWIANPISRLMYGLEGEQYDVIKTGIDTMKRNSFDVVFLCKSDNWLPPHLDCKFIEMAKCMINTFDNIRVQDTVLQERNYKELLNKTQKTLFNKKKSNKIEYEGRG